MWNIIGSVFLSQWTAIFVVLLFLFYKWSTSNYRFFEDRQIPHEKPFPLLGSFKGMLFKTENLSEIMLRLHNTFKHKRVYGMFEMRHPRYVLNDSEIIKKVTIKDFDHFVDHNQNLVDERIEPLFTRSLVSLCGQKWRHMRSTLSPAFTGNKMRQMFQLVVDSSEKSVEILREQVKDGPSVPYVLEMRELLSRFTTDIIATAAFGVGVCSLKDKNNEFFVMGNKLMNFSTLAGLKFFLVSICPKLFSILGIKLLAEEHYRFYRGLVKDAIAYREKNGVIRPDMIHLLMEARKGQLKLNAANEEKDEGFAVVEESKVGQEKMVKIVWEDDDLVAQCLFFFAAGFETSAILMSFAAHEITENRDVHDKLIQEIDDVREKLKGEPLTYDTLQKMKYLDMVISETLRKWPPAPGMDRLCVKPYVIEGDDGLKININVGDVVWIPILGRHRDPDFFPNPMKFDPERFSDENKHNILNTTYIPFGLGPRNCIGSRFALMESKAVLFCLLSAFTFEISPKTQIPLKLVPGFQMRAENGFNIELKPRN